MSQNSDEMSAAVLVVGYGPVGAALACLLGRYGIQTLVIDRSRTMFAQPRAIALDNEALRILQLVGLDDAAFPRLAIPHVRMHSPFLGEFGRVNTAGSIDTHPMLVTFAQPELETALRRQAESFDCIQVRTGLEAVEITDTGDGVITVIRDDEGRETRIRSAYLVGADGAASFVRDAIGQAFTGHTYAEDWLIIDALDVPRPIDHVEFLCDPKRPTPHMPAPGGRERWEFMLARGETREMMEDDARVAELLAPWLTPDQIKIERRAVYRFHARCCASFGKGRIALVGDAAHITPPFVGQGLVAGLRDASNLAWKLSSILQGRAHPDLLSTYDTERRPHARAMIGLAKLMGGMVMPRNAVRAMIVHGAMRLARRAPALRRFLDDLGVKPQNRFPKGFFVRGRGGAHLARGAQFPQAWVKARDGAVIRSDDALGSSFALVGFGVDPTVGLPTAIRRRWAQCGYGVLQIRHAGQVPSGEVASIEDLEGLILPKAAPFGCIAVVRPDRVVMTDGPAETATALVAEALAMLEAPPGALKTRR